MVLVFSVLTCGIYQLVWLYRTSEELKNCTNDTTINPGLDLILAIVTCGAWGWFVAFRNTQKVHQALLPLDPTRQDRSQMVLILFLLTLVVGVTGLVALYVAQEEYNALAKATRR